MRSAPAFAEEKVNLLDFDRQGLRGFFAGQGEKPFRADQVVQWVHQRGRSAFADMSNLSKPLRVRLDGFAEVRPPDVALEQISADGTRKWLLQLSDGNRIETVFIPEASRNTLCVSSQVGCSLTCSFCSTARQGFSRNLTTAEIIGQLWRAQRLVGEGADQRISNVVLMGMGEPLLNYDNVCNAIRLMLDDFAYGLSKRRVTLSTSGVVPAMDRLSQDCDVSLAVSLHATDDVLRDELVPINRKYPLAELLAACRRYLRKDGRRKITFEYVMLHDINDSPAHARALHRLLADVPAKVNLIPFNPFPGTSYQCSTPDAVHRFQSLLMERDLITTVRKRRGDDISAACGQLVGQVADRGRRAERFALQVSG